MARIFGLLFTGFAVKAYAIVAALYTAHYVYVTLAAPLAAVHKALS